MALHGQYECRAAAFSYCTPCRRTCATSRLAQITTRVPQFVLTDRRGWRLLDITFRTMPRMSLTTEGERYG
jgi:hypothetical protein